MDNLSPLTPEEKPNATALVLSAVVHLLLLGALFLGVQWKSQGPSSVAVEVWRSAPAPVTIPKPVPVPVPAPEPPPKPEPKPEPKPVPKVEPTPPAKPDIAIKEEPKQPEPRKEEPKKEEPKKPEPKKEEPKKPEPPKEEPKKPEPKREVPDFQKQIEQELKDTQRQKADAQAARERRDLADAEIRQLGQMRAEQAAQGRSRALADYTAKIAGKIRGHIVLPTNIQGNPEAVFDVTQLPSGEVLSVKVRKSSGNRALDEAIERAILKSSPLPKPDDPKLFERELKIPYRPKDE